MIEEQIQPEGTIQYADPPLDPRPKSETPPEPPLLLVALSFLGELAALGQDDALYTGFCGYLFVLH